MKLAILNMVFESFDSKKPHLLRMIGGSEEEAEKILNLCLQADPIAVKTDNKKTPFVKQIVKWYLDHKIAFPEDVATVRDVLLKYNEFKQKAPIDDISAFASPGDVRKIVTKEIDGLYDYLELAGEIPGFKMYKISIWEEGEKAFADSGWCVQNKDEFDDYGPPYYMITKGDKRYALLHEESCQAKDVQDDPLDINLAKPIDKFIKMVWPEFKPEPDGDLVSICELWPGAKGAIMKHPSMACKYAMDVIKGRWPEAEPAIAKKAYAAFIYAKNILKRRWPEAEPAIATEAEIALQYAMDVIKGRWPEAEPAIAKKSYCAFMYAMNVIKGRWPEAEPVITKHPQAAERYAEKIIKGRWPEAESTIIKDPHEAFVYAAHVLKRRWPEAEPIIAANSLVACKYAMDVIKGRWPEAELTLAKDPETESIYKKFINSK